MRSRITRRVAAVLTALTLASAFLVGCAKDYSTNPCLAARKDVKGFVDLVLTWEKTASGSYTNHTQGDGGTYITFDRIIGASHASWTWSQGVKPIGGAVNIKDGNTQRQDPVADNQREVNARGTEEFTSLELCGRLMTT